MNLQFYDATHTYELNGQIIPSVSEILRFLSREVYGNDAFKYQQDLAAERGTAVHKATWDLDVHGECEVEESQLGYVEAYKAFALKHKPSWFFYEHPMAHNEMMFAGTPDRIGVIRDDKYAILDIKTSCTICKPLVKAQLNGYKILFEKAVGVEVDELYCLQLLPTGKYRLYPVAIDDSEFMWCYGLHCSMKKKHGRGRID